MSRWILPIIPFICLLLLTGNCRCDNYEVPRSEHEYDPVKAAQVDSVIADLTAKVATANTNIEDLKAKLADLEEKMANQATNTPSLDEFNKQLLRLGILEQQIISLSTDRAMQEKFEQLNDQIAKLKQEVIEVKVAAENARRGAIEAETRAKEAADKAESAKQSVDTAAAAADKASKEAIEAETKVKDAAGKAELAKEDARKKAQEIEEGLKNSIEAKFKTFAKDIGDTGAKAAGKVKDFLGGIFGGKGST